jgi:hypothetical protein
MRAPRHCDQFKSRCRKCSVMRCTQNCAVRLLGCGGFGVHGGRACRSRIPVDRVPQLLVGGLIYQYSYHSLRPIQENPGGCLLFGLRESLTHKTKTTWFSHRPQALPTALKPPPSTPAPVRTAVISTSSLLIMLGSKPALSWHAWVPATPAGACGEQQCATDSLIGHVASVVHRQSTLTDAV